MFYWWEVGIYAAIQILVGYLFYITYKKNTHKGIITTDSKIINNLSLLGNLLGTLSVKFFAKFFFVTVITITMYFDLTRPFWIFPIVVCWLLLDIILILRLKKFFINTK